MDHIKADNLAKAIRLLPKPQTYAPETVIVKVEKENYFFYKSDKNWCFDFKKSVNQ